MVEGRCKDYESKIALLSQEIERLNSVIRKKNEDMDAVRRSYSELEISYKEAKSLEYKLRDYENKIALLS